MWDQRGASMASIRDVLNNLARDYAIAWSSGDADAVAGFFASNGQITFNDGESLPGAVVTETVTTQMVQ